MQLLTFALGGIKFGVRIEFVKSIDVAMKVTQIPHSFSYIKGITNFHNTVIPIYSLARKMNYPESTMQNVIIAEVDGIQMGFEVEEVREIMDVPGEQVIPMPNLISHDQIYLTDVAHKKEELVVLLDLKKIIEQESENIKKILEDAATEAEQEEA